MATGEPAGWHLPALGNRPFTPAEEQAMAAALLPHVGHPDDDRDGRRWPVLTWNTPLPAAAATRLLRGVHTGLELAGFTPLYRPETGPTRLWVRHPRLPWGGRFLCPTCGAVSTHPVDAAEGYCGACREFHP